MPRRIVLATDGSPSALAAACYLATLGLDRAGTELAIIHVLARPWVYSAVHAAAATPPSAAAGAEGAAGAVAHARVDAPVATLAPSPAAGSAIAATLAALGPLGAGARVQFATGDPSAEIVDFARRLRADLIVVGRRGPRPTAGSRLGSVCAEVLHTAPCAVLVMGRLSDV